MRNGDGTKRRPGLLARLLADNRGSIAVEGAFVVIALMALMMPLVDFSRYVSTQVELKQALRAGGQYALYDSKATASGDDGAIEQTIIAATNVTITAADITIDDLSCECTDGTAAICVGESNYVGCGTGGLIAPAHFMTITASVTFDPFFPHLPWFSENMTLSEKLTMRVR